MDNPVIMVDYSETTGVLQIVNDFQLILFPDSPPKVAVCITDCAQRDDTFVIEKTPTMEPTNRNQKDTAAGIEANLMQIIQENTRLAEAIDYCRLGELISHINQASAIFLIASGRSGFVMRSVAMRLMHLGLRVFFVGETITPAIQKGDLLWAASGSGTTSTIVKAAEKAKLVGAAVVAMTTNGSSTLARSADLHILIPAAEKEDHNGAKSIQYAGSLFEQAVLLLGDAVFTELWKLDGTPAEALYKRHSNME